MGLIKVIGCYKNISENTIQHVSLHDCSCTVMHWDKALMVLEMEWMEVLEGELPDGKPSIMGTMN